MKPLIFILLFVSVSAFAQSRIVSIDAFDLSYTGGILFKHDDGKRADRDETTFRLNLNYAQNLAHNPGLMWKAKVYFNREEVDFGSADTYEMTYGAAGGAIYNFQADDIKNSLFAGAMVGIERATYEIGREDDQSGFNFFADLEFGKRWDLGRYAMANIAYAPTVSVTFKRYGGDIRDDYYRSGNEVKLNFLKFDILF